MNNTRETLEKIKIGLDVATYLLKTDRGIQASDLCDECVILLNNLDFGINGLDVSEVIFNAYYAISGYTNAISYTIKPIDIFYNAGISMKELGDKYLRRGRFAETKKLFESVVAISKTIGFKSGEAITYGSLGCVFELLGEYNKAKEHHGKALAIATEIGDRKGEGVCYENLGNVFKSLGEYQKAKEYYEKALVIATQIGDRKGEGRQYGNLGVLFRSLGEYQKAKEYHEKALAIATEIGDRGGERVCYGNLGNVFGSLGEYQKAKEYHENALAIATEIGAREKEGTCYGNLGCVFESLGEYQKAKEYHEKALAIATEFGDRGGERVCYGNLGNVFLSLGEYQKAKEYHENALAIATEIGAREGEGTCYGNLGCVFESLGEYQKAKEYHEKALAIATEIGAREGEGRCYGNLGDVFLSLGEYQKAKEYCEKAIVIATQIGDRKGEGTRYGNLGCVFQSFGEYQKAEEYHEKALVIATQIGDWKGEGTQYGNLGALFKSLGEYQKAKEYYEKALDIVTEIGDRKGEGRCYVNLGGVFLSLRKNKAAKEHFDKALTISTETGERNCEGWCYAGLADVFYSFHDYQKATELYEKMLTISMNVGDKRGQGLSYLRLGGVSLSLGNYDQSEKFFNKARSMSSKIRGNMIYFKSLLGITRVKMSQSKLEDAMQYLRQSIEIYEKLRNFLKGNDEFKTSLLEEHGNFPYKLLRKMLCDNGRLRDSLNVEELRRARGLAELMADKLLTESHISTDSTYRPGIESIVSKESNCAVLYISYCERHVHLWVLKANGHIDHRVSPEIKIDTLIAAFVCDVEDIFKKSASSFGILLNENCEDRSLGDDTSLSPQEQSRAPLQGDQMKRNESILQLCYDQIIAPVKDLLTEPEVIIVPEKCSYRVPFAALRDEPAGKYLSETHRIRIVPSLTTLGIIQECPADYHSQTGALVVGDPKAGQVQYRGRTLNLEPLSGARKEAEMVGRLLGVQPLLGEHATKQAVLHALHSVSLIHLAAHGHADRGEIALTPNCATNGIPQEEDYLLTMSDISKVKLRAKMVVLSCCHSGRGTFKQEGVIGIARAFLASGARSVLVASWAIQDEATEQLMNHFYEHLAAGESASESLHQAIKWLRSNGFTEPRQWAPFVLMGDNVTFDLQKLR